MFLSFRHDTFDISGFVYSDRQSSQLSKIKAIVFAKLKFFGIISTALAST